MKHLLYAAGVLVVAVGLTACASHPARQSGRAPAPAASADTAPDSARDTTRDNIHLSQAQRYRIKHDRAPDRVRADIDQLPEPVPRVESRSRYGNKSPYTVNGKTYRVLTSAKGYDDRGLASWYGKKFDGYLTSSMERYDMFQFSAASKVLPLPTYARVTNLANGKSVIVRVNDRGPFVSGRIIDLSYAAAVRIGVWPKGTGRVEVRAIDPAHPGELPKPVGVASSNAKYVVWLQAGAFSDRGNARRLAQQLRGAHLPVQVKEVTVNGRRVQRVRLGPLRGATQVEQAKKVVRRLGLPAPQVTVE